jgi:hypothetical protein
MSAHHSGESVQWGAAFAKSFLVLQRRFGEVEKQGEVLANPVVAFADRCLVLGNR